MILRKEIKEMKIFTSDCRKQNYPSTMKREKGKILEES